MLPWVIAFIVLDIVVTVLILRHILARRSADGGEGGIGLLDLGKLRAFADAIHPRIGEYAQANWSGQFESLPGLLAAVLDQASATAREMELDLDRDVLKRLVEHSLARHGVARPREIREALKQVA